MKACIPSYKNDKSIPFFMVLQLCHSKLLYNIIEFTSSGKIHKTV